MFDEAKTVHRAGSPRVGLIVFGGCGIVLLATAVGAVIAYLVHVGPFADATPKPSPSARGATSASAAPSATARGKR
jgi:hypothetical protein